LRLGTPAAGGPASATTPRYNVDDIVPTNVEIAGTVYKTTVTDTRQDLQDPSV